MARQRGAALLLVLWVLALASLLLGNLAVSVQLQQRQSSWQRHHTQGDLAAEAGLHLAVAALMRDAREAGRGDDQAWRVDGATHDVRFGDSSLRIRIRSERGKLDLNAADARDLNALMTACGDGGGSQRIVQGLLARREALPLRMLSEARALPGMSDARYRCLLPEITVWSGYPRPDPALASSRLQTLLGLPRSESPLSDPGQIVTVSVVAVQPGGFRTQLSVTLVLQARGDGQKPFRVLRWQQ
ncbi:type II secretion system protein GspK [Salinicola aestuarinus]|uniref:type II secretion system protein GspK n=1 Tax=Salinicola aestuarinus TaxID=1949082 RepID=UPI000DA1EBD5|nr:type II secretion system protein GspK [Salinicola aestuarinus]